MIYGVLREYVQIQHTVNSTKDNIYIESSALLYKTVKVCFWRISTEYTDSVKNL